MKRIAIVTVIAALASAASLAGALSGPTCCACLEGYEAHTAQANGTAIDALFCAAAPGGNTTALASRCEALNGGLSCTGLWSNQTCVMELAEAGIVCPSSGVPTADPLNLTALAVVLGAAGMALLRRRSHRGA